MSMLAPEIVDRIYIMPGGCILSDRRLGPNDLEYVFGGMYDAACEEVKRLESELAEMAEQAFYQIASFWKGDDPQFGGWWDTVALSTARDLGDRLVGLGVFEKHPDGAGRRQFYKPVETLPEI